jgi:hypothetical protein
VHGERAPHVLFTAGFTIPNLPQNREFASWRFMTGVFKIRGEIKIKPPGRQERQDF